MSNLARITLNRLNRRILDRSPKWRLEVFKTHGKIYEASASQMFHVPIESIHKGDPLRQKGKIAELALGYGGSVGAMVSMGALKMGIDEEELQVAIFRLQDMR